MSECLRQADALVPGLDVARSTYSNCAACNYGGTQVEVLVHAMLQHLEPDKFAYRLVDRFAGQVCIVELALHLMGSPCSSTRYLIHVRVHLYAVHFELELVHGQEPPSAQLSGAGHHGLARFDGPVPMSARSRLYVLQNLCRR